MSPAPFLPNILSFVFHNSKRVSSLPLDKTLNISRWRPHFFSQVLAFLTMPWLGNSLPHHPSPLETLHPRSQFLRTEVLQVWLDHCAAKGRDDFLCPVQDLGWWSLGPFLVLGPAAKLRVEETFWSHSNPMSTRMPFSHSRLTAQKSREMANTLGAADRPAPSLPLVVSLH